LYRNFKVTPCPAWRKAGTLCALRHALCKIPLINLRSYVLYINACRSVKFFHFKMVKLPDSGVAALAITKQFSN
jgi:hypothetical protein